MSIVVPLHNDAEFVSSALRSCLRQTLSDIEIICVDDASTDATPEIVELFAKQDPRVRLIRHLENASAFQARRTGIYAARAPFVLFLDGDDELDVDAARRAFGLARARRADVVGFGVTIVSSEGQHPSRFEAALQPKFAELRGPSIVTSIFPVNETANGHLWRYLFATQLLKRAYEGIDEGLAFYRANDLPITFLALTRAQKYVSTPERLYRYHFRRGTSGHAVDKVDRFMFLLSGVEPIGSVRELVAAAAAETDEPASILASYDSARLHIVGNVIRGWAKDTTGTLQADCWALLESRVGTLDAVRAAASFFPEALFALSEHVDEPRQPASPVRNVLVMTAHLDTGGLQFVLLDQVSRLTRMGYNVTIAVFRPTNRAITLPPDVDVVVLDGSRQVHIDQMIKTLDRYDIDLVIDHHILYNERWPWLALTALAQGVPTIGWLHNFALRPVFDRTTRGSFIAQHARILLKLVTLSSTDVAFWKLLGLDRVVHLMNPPSDLALTSLSRPPVPSDNAAGELSDARMELVWWGRLDAPTKQVDHLIRVAAELDTRGVDFRLRIIGPDSKNTTAADLRKMAAAHGLSEQVRILGDMSHEELAAELSDAHIMVSTSAIEGFQLTILEAQAMGLPVVMYDLPWLVTTRGNGGLITTPPGDPRLLAEALVQLKQDPMRYSTLSTASRAFAADAENAPIDEQLFGLLTGTLPPATSPAPSIDESRILVSWLLRYAERSIQVARDPRFPSESAALRRATSELRHIKSGPSYRIGRVLTYLPRKAMRIARRRLE